MTPVWTAGDQGWDDGELYDFEYDFYEDEDDAETHEE